jgi:3-hydroxyacyl-CoA dehydrogenase/enoyl-CoA hydratase/3-hydroxybutyryl-CoA epimerase
MQSEDTFRNEAFEAKLDRASGVVTLTFAMPGRVNKVDRAMAAGLSEALTWVRGRDDLRGVILTSAHKNFCVGADIDSLFPMRDPAATSAYVAELNALFRRIETLGVPVVCALTGSALGGGYELALACHKRFALDDARLQVGLPEVSLGLIPGAGGTQRLPRLIGLQKAVEHITQGEPVRAPRALALGMVDALFPTVEALTEAALAFIAANPKAVQPWDLKGFRYPGAAFDSTEGRQLFMVACAMTIRKVGRTMPQVEAAICAIQEGAQVTFERALEIEGRYFTRCAVSDHAKDVTRTSWYHRNAAMKAEGLPRASDHGFRRVAILGAGMMGAGLAFSCADKGLAVVVKDVREEALSAARAHCEAEAAKKKHLTPEARAALLGRVSYALEDAAVAGCDLVIEAIVEDDAAKHAVTRTLEPLLADGAIWASNTSAIPIGHLAKASARPARFIGLHFFSPVEKMPLVEIIAGEATDEATIGRCVAFVQGLGKLPILVNDGYGFYTTRVFGAYLMEAVTLVAEGHDPVLVEQAARAAGMVMPPLKVFDEVTLQLGLHGLVSREKYTGERLAEHPGVRLLRDLVVTHGRAGKAAGGGFYDYSGPDRVLWSGLRGLVSATPAQTGFQYIQDRLMYAQVLEAVRCLEEGVLRERRDAEVGAVFGLGFAPGSGGPLAWLDRRGLPEVVRHLETLASDAGPRFAPPALLRRMAEAGERFWDL